MNTTTTPGFQPLPLDATGTVSWIHLGDLHMTHAGEQNEQDLARIVDTINRLYADGSVNFVYLPGDIADDGSAASYRVVRSHLDRLRIPWCGIVGDHDVHERSFSNFSAAISADLYSSFVLGRYRFLRLNAFAEPRPDAFIIDDVQLSWIESELKACVQQNQHAVLLLHCYPSDLKQGGDALTALLHRYPVLLVDMGHTHYNEISNDGRTLYAATRSTGQIEEGPVGFSLITIDGEAVSWHFVSPEKPDLVAITSPSDRRLVTELTPPIRSTVAVPVHAEVWSQNPVRSVSAQLADHSIALQQTAANLWSGTLPAHLPDGKHSLYVTAISSGGDPVESSIEIVLGKPAQRDFAPRDQDNGIGRWQERGLLGTQLGPNKNGRKW